MPAFINVSLTHVGLVLLPALSIFLVIFLLAIPIRISHKTLQDLRSHLDRQLACIYLMGDRVDEIEQELWDSVYAPVYRDVPSADQPFNPDSPPAHAPSHARSSPSSSDASDASHRATPPLPSVIEDPLLGPEDRLPLGARGVRRQTGYELPVWMMGQLDDPADNWRHLQTIRWLQDNFVRRDWIQEALRRGSRDNDDKKEEAERGGREPCRAPPPFSPHASSPKQRGRARGNAATQTIPPSWEDKYNPCVCRPFHAYYYTCTRGRMCSGDPEGRPMVPCAECAGAGAGECFRYVSPPWSGASSLYNTGSSRGAVYGPRRDVRDGTG